MTIPLRDFSRNDGPKGTSPKPIESASGESSAPARTAATQRGTTNRVRVLNLPLLLGTFGIVLTCGLGTFFWHRHQVTRQCEVFLTAAAQAEVEEDWKQAGVWLRQYLEYRPGDIDALARLAQATDKGASSRNDRLNSLVDYAKVLDKDPDRTEDRARLAELQLASNPQSALENAEKVLSAEPENIVALRVRAIAIDTSRPKTKDNNLDTPREEVASVLTAYEAALKHDPGQINIARRVATLYRDQAKTETDAAKKDELNAKADGIIDAMVAGAEDKATALLIRHQYRKETQPMGDAPKSTELDADLLEALKVAPDKPQVRLAIVDHLIGISPSEPLISTEADPTLDKALLAESKDHLEAAINGDPKDSRGYLGLSELYLKSGEAVKAADPLEEAVKQVGPLHPVINARLAVLYIQGEKWKEADEALIRLDQCVRDARIHQEVPVANRVEAISNLLRAEWLLEAKNPNRSVVRAAGLLKSASETNVSDSFSTAANIRLGKCHASLKQWDLAIGAFQNVIKVRPDILGPRLAAGEVLSQAGRLPEAIDQFKAAMALAAKAPGKIDATLILLPLSRVQLRAQLRLPADKRDWSEFDANIKDLRAAAPNSYKVALLDIEAQIARAPVDKRNEVVDSLKRAEHDFGEVREFWAAAFELYLRMGEVDSAEKASTKLEEMTGIYDAMTQARLLLARGDVAGAEELLREQGSSQDSADSISTLTSLAWLGFQTGRLDQSIDPLRRVAATQPQNIGVRYLLAQIAAQTENLKELEKWELELRNLEGADGSLWVFFKIQRLLLVAQQGNDIALKEAAALTRQLVARRPGWYLAHAAEGMIAEALGRPNEAIAAYRSAFDLGDRRPALSRRLLGLCILKQQEAEARSHLDQLSDQVAVSPEILPLAVYLRLQAGDVDHAVDLARNGVAALPIYAENHILLGQALMAGNRTEERLTEAETAFRKAVELSPGDASAWIALLHFYSTSEHPDSSLRSLEALRGTLELLAGNREVPTPAHQAFLIGRALQLVGDQRTANAYYREALVESPKDDPLLRRINQLGVFLLKEESAEDAVWTGQLSALPLSVRKVLGAVLVAARQNTPQILEMIAGDPRLHAVALAAQADPAARQDAIRLIQGIAEHNRTRGDWLLLARLQIMAGDSKSALRSFESMASRQPSAEQLREYATFALNQNAFDDARKALDATSHDPGRLAETLELQIRLLAAENKVQEAIELARKFATSTPVSIDDPSVQSRLGRLAAECLAKIGKSTEGTALLREVIKDDPYGHTVLADYLSLLPDGRDEAVELCLQSANREGAVRQAWFLANILAQGDTTADLSKRSEEFFSVVMKEDVRVLSSVILSLAVLREHQGNYDEAMKLTQGALKAEPGNVAHLNNQAWFYSCAGDHEKALDIIRQVIDVMGPDPAVLDTKGVALLGAQRPREAVRVLEASVETLGASPRTYLHLAEAYEALGMHEDSKRALSIALDRNRGKLPPRDQKALERLRG